MHPPEMDVGRGPETGIQLGVAIACAFSIFAVASSFLGHMNNYAFCLIYCVSTHPLHRMATHRCIWLVKMVKQR